MNFDQEVKANHFNIGCFFDGIFLLKLHQYLGYFEAICLLLIVSKIVLIIFDVF
jgi:hypothetical protein